LARDHMLMCAPGAILGAHPDIALDRNAG